MVLKYPRVEEAKKAVRDGHIKFFPSAGKNLPALAGQHSGLVHKQTTMVGA